MITCPPILQTTIISDDARLAAQLSCVFASKGAYLPLIDGPRMTRDDRDAEVIRRHNCVARAKAKLAVLAGLSDDAANAMQAIFPKSIRLHKFEDLASVAPTGLIPKGRLKWGAERIGLGLLTALRHGKLIEFAEMESPKDHVPSQSGHIVVCEEGMPLSEVIAANYAHSLGAGFYSIPNCADHKAKSVLEAFYGVHDHRDASPTAILQELRNLLRSLCSGIEVQDGGSITFVTEELPYGFAFPEVPTTHLFSYPDLGIAVVNGFCREQAMSRGTNVVALIDPMTTAAPEIEVAAKIFATRGALVRGYRGRNATVQKVSQAIELFPYDVLIIATHCGDSGGYRWTYEYTDSEGHDRTFVVDIAIGVADTGKNDRVAVTQFVRFHSLDGVAWDDPDRDDKLYVGSAIRDYVKRTQADELHPTLKEHIPRVPHSAVLKMFDHNYVALPRSLADKGLPIIVNNACASWRELAERFTFANARAYVGTLFPIVTREAHDVVVAAMEKHFDNALPHAFWAAQNAVYGIGVRRPYIVTGVYPQRFRVTPENASKRLLRLMSDALADWRARKDDPQVTPSHAEALTEIVEYYELEIDAIRQMFPGAIQ